MKNNELGKRIKELREYKKTTQKDLAKAIGTDQTRIAKWEKGQIEPDCDTIVKVADYFNVSTDYLLGRKDFD